MKRQRGFTLVEVLIVVAVIGMLASIAIPGLKAAILKSRRNAAISSLRVLKDAMATYNADFGSFPSYFKFRADNLTPLTPVYVPRADAVLRNFKSNALDFYLPWDIFRSSTITPDTLFFPDSYTCYATLRHKRDMHFILTDSETWLWTGRDWVPVGEN